jgi:fibronectin-binding autotransporter adhesin
MNRIYRIVFNRTLGVPQVVSELASAQVGAVIGGASCANWLRVRMLAAALGLALTTVVVPAWAQCVTTTGTIATSCTGTTSGDGGTGSGGAGTNPGYAGSGSGGIARNPGAGGAFGGSGGQGGTLNSGLPPPFPIGGGGGGGGGVYGGGGGASSGRSGLGGGGGGGNPGVIATGAISISTGVIVNGGGGGAGTSGYNNSYGGGGGGGAAGVSLGRSLGSSSLGNAGAIVGGSGGAGGSGTALIGGGGGGGGMGLSIGGSGNVVSNGVTGTITGGAGGYGGQGFIGGAFGRGLYQGNGGSGGAGLSVSGNGNMITTSGSIAGGAGGTGRVAGSGGVGVGISGAGNTLVVSGSISGSGSAAAVDITGSNNTLELLSGYSLNGSVSSTAGNGNILDLDGNIDASFNVGSVNGGFGSYLKQGSSTWSLTGTTGLVTPWTVNAGTLAISNNASLGASSGTLTLNGGTLEATASMTSTRAVTLGAAGGSISPDLGMTLTEAGVMSGPGSLTKLGEGKLVLTGVNTYTGGTTIALGTLAISSDASLGDIAGTLTVSGGTLEATASMTSNRTVVLGAGGGIISPDSGVTLTEAGVMSGPGPLIKSGGGELVLTGINSYTGETMVDAGTLAISSDANLGAISGTLTLSGGGMLEAIASMTSNRAVTLLAEGGDISTDPGVTLTEAGFIGGPDSLTKLGDGELVLTDVNGYEGGTTINAGTLAISSDANLGAISGALTLNGGTLEATASMTSNRAVALGAAGGSISTDNGMTLTEAGVISGVGSLTTLGGGELSLGGVDTYTGSTTISTGTLALGGNGSIASSSVIDNGTFDISATNAGASIQSLSGSGTVNLGGQTLTLTNAADTFNGAINGSGGLTLNAGTEMLIDTNTYTGNTLISAGTIALSGNGSIASSSVIDNGTFDISATNAGASIQSLSGSDVGTVNLGGQMLTLTNADGMFNGVISGSGGLTLNAGNETLTGNNTYTGSTNIAGTLMLNGNGNIANSNVFDNGIFDITGTNTGASIQSLSGDGLVILGTQTLVLNNAAGPFASIFSGVISGTGGLTLNAGNETLTGNNTYTGSTTINAGTLSINGGTVVSSSVFDNGTLNVAGLNSSVFAGGSIQVGINGAGVMTVSDDADVLGAIGLNIGEFGTGTLTVANAGSVNTPTVVIAANPGSIGTLNIGAAAGSAAAPSGIVNSANVEFGNGNASLVFNLTDTGYVFAPTISGVGTVDVLAGTTIFTADSTYTGNTTINGGTLQLGNGGTSGSIGTDVNDNGVLAFNRSDDMTFVNAINGSGSVTQLGTDNLTLSNTNTYSGGTTITAGKLTGTTSSFGSGAINDNAALVLSQSTNGTFANAISGSGSLTVNGAAVITLSGINSYSGGTTISSGALIGDSNSLQGAIADNMALTFNQGFDGIFSGVLSGAGTLSKTGTGTLSLSADSSAFTGATNVSAGTLLVDGKLGGNVDVTTTIGGQGTLSGNATIENGGVLAPGDQGSIGTLSVGGNLLMQQGSTYNMDVGAAGVPLGTVGSSDSVSVTGNLTLNGVTLNVDNAGSMGPGIYRIFDYSGALSESNGGITLGNIPAGDTLSIQTLTADNQINLVNATSLTIGFWNANGQASSTQAGGGSGIWSVTAQDWSTSNGSINSAMTPQPGFAVFGGAPGTVTLDNSAGAVSTTGMQFASNGYLMTGDTLTLVANAGAAPIIRVGDGSVNGASYSAEIDNVLAGTAGLDKTDYGTLILAGNNTYTGGTTVGGGTLQIGNGGTTGSVLGDVVDNGVLAFDRSDAVNFCGTISGNGSVTQIGTGTLTLTGADTYTGVTTISSGTLVLSGNGSIAASSVVDNAVFDISNSTGASITSLSGNGNVALGVQTLTLSNAADTFSGIIAGVGGLTLAGGTETLTGTNTYTGVTTISSGTLALSGNGSIANSSGVIDNAVFDISNSSGVAIISLSGNGNVALGAQMLTLSNAADTFSGVIAGSGGLALNRGTEILAGSNTYTGGTTINAGTLQIGNGGAAGSIVGNIVNNGILAFDRSDSFSFGGTISGSGGVMQTGSGSLTLTADNSYSGGTELNAGTLNVGSNTAIGSGTLAMAASTTLNLNGNFTLANAITLSGDPTINVGTGQTSTLSGGISNGTQAGDLVKTGAGTLVLTGTDTYTGSTEVAAGTLDVEGHLASTVSVVNGAALIGNGSLGGLDLVSGTTIAPGNSSIGILTIDGNATLASGSKYAVNATNTGSSDLIEATGTATLGGGSVIAIAAGSNWQPFTHYTILTAAGGVNGSFGAVSSNFAFLTPTLTYAANSVSLTLTRNATGFPTVGVTANQSNTGAAVEALSPGNSVFDAVLPLRVAPARSAFVELSGDSLASTRTAIVDDSRFVRDAINNHLQGVQESGDVAQSDNDGSVWTNAWSHGGDEGNEGNDGNAARMSDTGSGLLVGADRNLDAWRLGAVVGTGELSNNSTYGAADAHSTDTVFGLYTGYNVDAWQFQGGAAHSWYQTSSHRQIDLVGVGGTNGGNYDNGVTQAYVDGGYQFTFTQSSLTPYVDLARVWLHQGSINEVGSAAALDVQASGTSVNYATVGLRGMFSPTPGLQLHANVGYQHAWGDLSSIDTQSFANGGSDNFTVAGLPVSKNVGVVDFGMRFALSKNVTADASYHGQFASNMKDEGARLSLNVSF